MPPRSKDQIVYRFHLAHGVQEIALEFDSETFALLTVPETTPPDWTRLDFLKCGHCPLSSATTPHCPFAAALSGFLNGFANLYSYEAAQIEVKTRNRTVVSNKPLQIGIASLVGLIGATSGCPHLAFFRPMAKFHTPFADEDETIYRVLSMYLLGCYLAQGTVVEEPLEAIARLGELNRAVNVVNEAIAERLRSAFERDAVVNAIVILDCFAQFLPLAIEANLEDFRGYFAAAGGIG